MNFINGCFFLVNGSYSLFCEKRLAVEELKKNVGTWPTFFV